MELVKPKHGTTTLGFIFKQGVIIAVDSRASMGSYICRSRVYAIMLLMEVYCDHMGLPSTCSLESFINMCSVLPVQPHRR